MLQSWSIGRRVGFGFAVMTLGAMTLAVISVVAVNNLGTSYTNYKGYAKDSIAIDHFVEDLFEARIASLKYRTTLSESDAAEVRSNILEITQNDEIHTLQGNADRAEELATVMTLAERYLAGVDDLGKRYKVINALKAQIGPTIITTGEMMEDVASRGTASNSTQVVSRANAVRVALFETRILKDSFRETETTQLIRDAQSILDEARDQVNGLGNIRVNSPDRATLDQAQTNIESIQGWLAELETHVMKVASIRDDILDTNGPDMQNRLEMLADSIRADQVMLGEEGAKIVDQTTMLTFVAGSLVVLTAIGLTIIVGRWVSGPIARLANTTQSLAGGDTTVEIEGAEYDTEMGRMAKALCVFRTTSIEAIQRAKDVSAAKKEQETVVEAISVGLRDLASGRLNTRLASPFPAEYEKLREDFNAAVIKLETALVGVIASSETIEGSAVRLNTASDELSQRTENQAATLEETAAALDELTASVKSSADGARQVEATVSKARTEAENSGDVVRQAVSAMSEIESSATEISKITQVIGDIAFQTNLLALNAGVEAARAGEFGRGFAVVASEVRALAQRSSQAAKDVTRLINVSTEHVADGTRLVGGAGEALTAIIDRVNHISTLISGIAGSTDEQATGLSEINLGVTQLDQVTQQNASMVEESTTLGRSLAAQSRELGQLVGQFTTSQKATLRVVNKPEPEVVAFKHTPDHTQTRPAQHVVKVSGSSAMSLDDSDVWEDF